MAQDDGRYSRENQKTEDRQNPKNQARCRLSVRGRPLRVILSRILLRRILDLGRILALRRWIQPWRIRRWWLGRLRSSRGLRARNRRRALRTNLSLVRHRCTTAETEHC